MTLLDIPGWSDMVASAAQAYDYYTDDELELAFEQHRNSTNHQGDKS